MDYSHTMDVMCESGVIRCEKPTLLCSTLSVLVGHTLAGMSMYTSTYASSYDLSRRAFASPQATASGTLGRTHYSSEQFSSTYVAPTLGDGSLPGAKWSTKKFNNGIHASAANERYIAMRKDREDLRPFGGCPFDPKNTFVTTGPWRQQTAPSLAVPVNRVPALLPGSSAAFSSAVLAAPPPSTPSLNPPVQPLTWARLKASR